MGQLQAVRIIHDRKNPVLYNLISYFFKICGIFVVEECPGSGIRQGGKDGIQFTITLPESPLPRKLTLEQACLTDSDVIQKTEELFGNIFLEMKDNNIRFPEGMVREILSVYLKSAAVIPLSNLEYYPVLSEIHNNTKATLIYTIRMLERLEEKFCFLKDPDPGKMEDPEKQGYLVYHYALLFFKQKLNLSCWFFKDREYNMRRGNGALCDEKGFLWEARLVYRVSELYSECLKLIDKYPQNAALYMLLGMITERASDGYQVAADAYEQALQIIGKTSYASYLYYRLGLLHERQEGKLSDAKKSYAEAYLIQKNFRTIYKVAVMFEHEKNYDRFSEFLVQCCKSLKKGPGTLMTPVEMRYYYSACLLLCIRSLQYRNNKDTSIQYGEEILSFYQTHIQKDRFDEFYRLYGNDAAVYQKESMQGVSFRKVHETLTVAYRMAGDMEKSEEHRRCYSLGSL